MFSTGYNSNRENLNVTNNESYSEQISHPNQVTKVNTFINTSEILTIPVNVNKIWKCIQDALITETFLLI